MCVLGCFEPLLTHACTLLPGKDYTPPPSVVKLSSSAPVSPPEARVENYGDVRCSNTPWLPTGQYCRWCAKGSSISRCDMRGWILSASNADKVKWRKRKEEEAQLLVQSSRLKRHRRQNSAATAQGEQQEPESGAGSDSAFDDETDYSTVPRQSTRVYRHRKKQKVPASSMIRRSQVHEPGEGQGSSSKEQGYQHEIMKVRCTLYESGIEVAAKDKAMTKLKRRLACTEQELKKAEQQREQAEQALGEAVANFEERKKAWATQREGMKQKLHNLMRNKEQHTAMKGALLAHWYVIGSVVQWLLNLSLSQQLL